MAIQNIIRVFLHAAVVRPGPISPTSAPRTTVYKIPDVLLQPPKIKTDTLRKMSSGSSPQTRAEAGKTIPRIDPHGSQTKTPTWRRIPGTRPNPARNTITAITPVVSQTKTDAWRKTQGITLNQSTTNTDPLKNISGFRPDQVEPHQPKISNAVAQPPPGKPNFSNNLYQLYFLSILQG